MKNILYILNIYPVLRNNILVYFTGVYREKRGKYILKENVYIVVRCLLYEKIHIGMGLGKVRKNRAKALFLYLFFLLN